jgi:hypothetical protein
VIPGGCFGLRLGDVGAQCAGGLASFEIEQANVVPGSDHLRDLRRSDKLHEIAEKFIRLTKLNLGFDGRDGTEICGDRNIVT